jgi:hypothetical protein
MATFRIVSNYTVHGLAYAVKAEAHSLRKALHIRADVARRMALITVRTALVQAINNGGLRNV